MNEESVLLSELLGKYEKSAHYRETSQSSRRVLLKLGPKSKDLPAYDVENSDAREKIHQAVYALKKGGWIDYKWEKFEEGNILSEIWLILDRVDDAYRLAGRIPKKEQVMRTADRIHQLFSSSEENSAVKNWIAEGLLRAEEKIRRTYELPSYLSEDTNITEGFLTCMKSLANPEAQPASLRIVSLTLFRDSKRLERDLLSKIKTFARKNHPDFTDLPAEENISEEELLGALNLYRNPEIYEFCGPVRIHFSNSCSGMTVDFAALTKGAALHASNVPDITSVNGETVTSVLFIENRTNYEEYITNTRSESELVIYHGGFHNPSKRDFFRKLIAGIAPDVRIYHWGDIDLGGMRIFLQIQKDIAPKLIPRHMDPETLLSMHTYAVSFGSEYEKMLLAARKDEKFKIFYDLIDGMLENKIRLEQEAFLA